MLYVRNRHEEISEASFFAIWAADRWSWRPRWGEKGHKRKLNEAPTAADLVRREKTTMAMTDVVKLVSSDIIRDTENTLPPEEISLVLYTQSFRMFYW